MFEVSSERLKIIALDLSLFELMIEDYSAMKRKLNLLDDGVELPEKEAMEFLLGLARENESNFVWYTNWQIVTKKNNCAVGSIGFIGPPNERGEVEIGYGIHEPYRGLGYMTEAVIALKDWVFMQGNVLVLTAKTDKDNPASWHVLLKAGFVKIAEDDGEDHFVWGVTNSSLRCS